MQLAQEQIPKLYGLGKSEQKLVGGVNEAITFLLSGVPQERQVEVIDHFFGEALGLQLQ